MNKVYAVVVTDVDGRCNVESIHATPEGAKIAADKSQFIWGKGTALNPSRFVVHVRHYSVED